MAIVDTAEPALGRDALESVARQIHDVASLPQVALRVMEVVQDPNAGATELKAAMECDPALSARVLRCVNSSAYATRTKITNLQFAIAYLGTQQIRNLAMTAAVASIFRSGTAVGRYSRAGLWKHLVATGICARLIAMRSRMADFEDAFLAGLLHDIGIVLADQHLDARFSELMQSLNPEQTLAQQERAVYGFDHTMLGEYVARQWRFPEAVLCAIRHHHMSTEARCTGGDIVRCVEVANLLCSMKGIASVGSNLVKFSRPALTALALTKDDILVLAQDLDQELASNQYLLTLQVEP